MKTNTGMPKLIRKKLTEIKNTLLTNGGKTHRAKLHIFRFVSNLHP